MSVSVRERFNEVQSHTIIDTHLASTILPSLIIYTMPKDLIIIVKFETIFKC